MEMERDVDPESGGASSFDNSSVPEDHTIGLEENEVENCPRTRLWSTRASTRHANVEESG
jgi:hypothetical protein